MINIYNPIELNNEFNPEKWWDRKDPIRLPNFRSGNFSGGELLGDYTMPFL